MPGATLPALLHSYASPALPTSEFITLVRGEGSSVWDNRGRRYVDALASMWYCQIGHGRREVVEAISRQAGQLATFHTADRYTNEPAEQLACSISDLAPMSHARVFLTSGGSESVETALKLSRLSHTLAGQPQRTIIVSRKRSYHGVAYGGLSATGLATIQAGFGPLLPDMEQVPTDSLAAIDRTIEEHGDRIAAIIAEPVIGSGGVLPPSPGYLEGLRQRCDAIGALLIIDEVTCGFGRLGHWWGAQRYGVEPDLVAFAKGVSSGYLPLGGVIVGARVREALEADPHYVLRHGYTFSGHPIACAAGLANLDVLRSEQLVGPVADRIGERLDAGLRTAIDGERVVDVRGCGALRAVVFARGFSAVAVRDKLLQLGVIARPIGEDLLAFCPPLVIGDDDLDHCVQATCDAIVALSTGSSRP